MPNLTPNAAPPAKAAKKLARGCACGQAHFCATEVPRNIHACHCSWCQRETGTVFALNALSAADRVERSADRPEDIPTRSDSALGQHIHCCIHWRVAPSSTEGGAHPSRRLREEACGLLLHKVEQRGLFQTVPLALD